MNDTSADLLSKLHAPFEPEELEWNRVFGLGGWQTSYQPLPDGNVVCTLRVRVGEEWVSHADVGGPSEQPDAGDRMKAAFSDSLKRAAVHVGVGRYLYKLTPQWVEYDPAKRRFLETPRLPDWAVPAKRTSKKSA